MAPRKTPTRRKRTSRGKKSSHSLTSVMTVGVIIAAGATALWASTQNKSPSASVSQLFTPLIASTGWNSDTRSNAPTRLPPQRTVAVEPRIAPQKSTPTTAPAKAASTDTVTIPRPQMPLGNIPPATAVAALQPAPQRNASVPVQMQTPVQPRPASTANTAKPASTANAVKPAITPITAPRTVQSQPENGNSRHANGAYKVPKVIYARQTLQIREKAWDQAKLMGSVEKGREMRSYAKVGRWHRVVVPSTNIIGWVQEDQLVIKDAPRQLSNQQNRKRLNEQKSAARPDPHLTTGALKRGTPAPSTPNKPAATAKPSYTKPLYPSQPVGKH